MKTVIIRIHKTSDASLMRVIAFGRRIHSNTEVISYSLVNRLVAKWVEIYLKSADKIIIEKWRKHE